MAWTGFPARIGPKNRSPATDSVASGPKKSEARASVTRTSPAAWAAKKRRATHPRVLPFRPVAA
jgi:hypothetical protein